MPFSRLAENRIREATPDGVFNDLRGRGTPLNVNDYFSTPEDVPMAYSILKNANCAPPELDLITEVSRLGQAVARVPDTTTRDSLQRELTNRQTELAFLRERGRRRRP
jgi:hypothetical protein